MASLAPWLLLVADDRRRRRPVPRGLLLLFQVAAVVLISLASADPRRPRAVSGGTVFVVDTTTSVAAGQRWGDEWAIVRRLAATAAGPFSLVTLGPSPAAAVRQADDAVAILRAADDLRPAGSGIDWVRAGVLARAVGDPSADVHVITDGCERRSSQIGEAARWWTVGKSEPNVAVVEAQSRALAGRTRLYARIANFGPDAAEVPVRLIVDGIERDRLSVRLEPHATHEAVWTVPQGEWAEVRADAADALPDDDWATVPLVPARVQAQAIGLSEALARAVMAAGDIDVREAGPANYRLDGSVEVTFAEGTSLAALPPGGVVLFDPPGTSSAAGGEGAARVTAVMDHPIGRGLDLVGAGLSGTSTEAGDAMPVWGRSLLEADGRIVAYAGTDAGSRVVVFAFDAGQSEVARRLGFPVLVARAMAWAARSPRPPVSTVGSVLEIGNLPARVSGPGGSDRPVTDGRLELDRPGRYLVSFGKRPGTPTWYIGVRAGSDQESDLTVRDAVAPASKAGTRAWPGSLATWLAVGALAVLGAEGVFRGSREASRHERPVASMGGRT